MLKNGTLAHHVRGFGAWLKLAGILYLLGESSLAAESGCLIYNYQARPVAFYKVPTLKVSLYEARGLAHLRKIVLEHFTRLK